MTALRAFGEPMIARIDALTAKNVQLSARIASTEWERAKLVRERDQLRATQSSGRELLRLLIGRVRARIGLGGSEDVRGAVYGASVLPLPMSEYGASVLPLPMSEALIRASARGIEIGSIVDVGASDGQWTAMCRQVFPDAHAVLLDVNMTHRPALERFCAANVNTSFSIAAVGPERRELWFERAADPFGGRVHTERGSPDWLPLPGTTIDYEIATRALPGPYLIKLDTHGYEVPILLGATKALEQAAVVVIECYAFRIADDSLLFHEMCAWMWERGFMAVDLCEPLNRPRDGCLWQVDVVFTPRTRPECATRSFA